MTLPIFFLIIFAIQLAFFAFAAIRKTDLVTDLAYGSTFAIMAGVLYFISDHKDPVKLAIFLTILYWGVRLAGYLFIRVLAMKKDKRFDGIRENFFKFASFWSLQTVAIFIIMMPSFLVLTAEEEFQLNLLTIVGLMIAIFGTTLEGIADYQKFKFKNNPANKGKMMMQGLWKYSRHPNYLGEMLMWWGIFIATGSHLEGIQFFSIISPIFIMILLLFVSGVPTLEKRWKKKYGDDPEFREYMEKTPKILVV